nr:hypothetical protein BaRGS_027302 [Batillaria attramentaria]
MELAGKGVFLTGGARGFGRGMVEALLEKGAKVMFCDVKAELGLATESELRKRHGVDNVIFRQCDVSDASQLKAAFEAAVSKFGAVDICVNNAAILDERVWEKMMEINSLLVQTDLKMLMLILMIFRVAEVVAAFMQLVTDQENDAVIFVVSKGVGGKFHKRQVVDMDGVSNPFTVD